MTVRMHQACWPLPDLDARLRQCDAVVCTASLLTYADQIDATLEVLASRERVRVAGYTNAVVARRFASGRRLLREMLGVALGVRPRDVALREGLHGKPELASASAERLWFSVSHADDLLVVALSRRFDIGVDVERVRSFEQWQRVADRVLDARERAQLQRAVEQGEEPGAAFLRHWCRVEAELKAVGCGIQGLEAHRAGGRPRGLQMADLAALPLPPGVAACGMPYTGALALVSPGASYPTGLPSVVHTRRESAQATSPTSTPAIASTP